MEIEIPVPPEKDIDASKCKEPIYCLFNSTLVGHELLKTPQNASFEKLDGKMKSITTHLRKPSNSATLSKVKVSSNGIFYIESKTTLSENKSGQELEIISSSMYFRIADSIDIDSKRTTTSRYLDQFKKKRKAKMDN